MIVPDLLEKPIILIDIGAVGNPPSHWLPLKDEIHLIGFEPNKDECKKLNESGCGYRKSEFFLMQSGNVMRKDHFTSPNTMNAALCLSLILNGYNALIMDHSST